MIKSFFTWFKRFFGLLWFVVLTLLVIKFILDNPGTLDLKIFSWQVSDVSIPTVALGLIGMGMLIVILALGPWLFLQRLRIRSLSKRLESSKSAMRAVAKVDYGN